MERTAHLSFQRRGQLTFYGNLEIILAGHVPLQRLWRNNSMTDALTIIAVVAIGSTVWFGVQTFAWFIGLGRFCAYHSARGVVIGSLIVFPFFMFLLQGLRFAFGLSESIGEFILMPAATAWVLLLSLAGLRVAAKLKRLPTPPAETTNAEPGRRADGSRPIRSE